MKRDILHVDANNFYASCELLTRPFLKDKPVAVCPNLCSRHSIILAKNELAKKYDIKTGEPKFLAIKKCKDIVFIEPDYDRYVKYSKLLFDIYCRYTDRVESFGIDECWLDVTESKKLFGSPLEIAKKISEDVKNELKLTVSIGVSFTKYFAKIGSDYKKPDAITIINEDNYKKIVWPLPISSLLMVGQKTDQILSQFGIRTIGELANKPISFLINILGNKRAKNLHEQANGVAENEEVIKYYDDSLPLSISHNTTLTRDISDFEEIKSVLFSLSEMIHYRMKEINVFGTGISIVFKDNSFKSTLRQITLSSQIKSTRDILENALTLYQKYYFSKKDKKPLRLIGIGVFNLTTDDFGTQLSLDDINKKILPDLEESLNEIRRKYGFNSIKPAIMIEHKDLCSNLTPKDFYAFRDNHKKEE